MEPVTFITEPLLSPEFVQYSAVIPLLTRIRRHCDDVAVAAPSISRDVQEALEELGIQGISAGGRFPILRRSRDEVPSYIWSWTRDAIFRLNGRAIDQALAGRPGVRVNFTMTSACRSDLWYVQSNPLDITLDALRRGVDRRLARWIQLVKTPVGRFDWHHLHQIARRAGRVYSSTRHVASWFTRHGISVAGVLPSFYRHRVGSRSEQPSRDYVLSYLGKETDSAALRMLFRTGIPLKLFGTKSASWVGNVFEDGVPPHVEVLGHVSDEELLHLYSNARFTAFPFTEEPFGLIPVESMASGTPVLTYRRQGPAETVLHGRTGWLAGTREEFVQAAQVLFHEAYPGWVPFECMRRAAAFSVDRLADVWCDVLDSLSQGAPDPPGILPREEPISTLDPFVWTEPAVLPGTVLAGFSAAAPGLDRRRFRWSSHLFDGALPPLDLSRSSVRWPPGRESSPAAPSPREAEPAAREEAPRPAAFVARGVPAETWDPRRLTPPSA